MPDDVIGYDGELIKVGDRVELNPACDLWMRGAKYGTVIGISSTLKDKVRVRLDRLPQTWSGPCNLFKRIGERQ